MNITQKAHTQKKINKTHHTYFNSFINDSKMQITENNQVYQSCYCIMLQQMLNIRLTVLQ